MPAEQKRKVVRDLVVTASTILVVFGLVGNLIFSLFQTSIHAFRIAGGILLFMIGFTTIYGERSGARMTAGEHAEVTDRDQIGVVPLGTPLFAGPGAITTVIVFMGGTPFSNQDPLRIALVLLAIGLTMTISWVLLSQADRVFVRLGRSGVLAFSRIMGLILAAIAIQFIIQGVLGAYQQCFLQGGC